MHPAFSVIFLTVFMGLGQGLFLALTTAEIYDFFGLLPAAPSPRFFVLGSALSVVLLVAGLVASFFHLGHPERAWRAAAQWRTSWLSREVLILPVVMAIVALYGLLYFVEFNPVLITRDGGAPVRLSLAVSAVGTLASFALFVCTAMIYACIKFLREWHSPLTVVNYMALGGASGFVLATALAAMFDPPLTGFYGGWALILTAVALITRSASLIRNARLRPKSTPQTAIGVHHVTINQKTQGAIGGSFNTREFFHGMPAAVIRSLRVIFLVAVFAVPALLVAIGTAFGLQAVLIAAIAVQFAGLLVERWYFFAEANHPQNIYYQSIA